MLYPHIGFKPKQKQVGMLAFLVLRTLYVATLQRSLVLLLRYMLLRCRDLWNN